MTTSNPDRQAMGSWARYFGLGTQVEADDLIDKLLAGGLGTWVHVPRLKPTTSSPDRQAIGSWAMYLSLSTQGGAADEQS